MNGHVSFALHTNKILKNDGLPHTPLEHNGSNKSILSTSFYKSSLCTSEFLWHAPSIRSIEGSKVCIREGGGVCCVRWNDSGTFLEV